MIRPGGSYWCGYVDLTPAEVFLQANQDHWEELESRTHYGFTGSYVKMRGFDCSHHSDYWYDKYREKHFCLDTRATYKDHAYVLAMIDYMADAIEM